jgi:hypothetical protein
METKELIAWLLLSGVFFLIAICFLIIYHSPDENECIEEEREEAKYRHWDED